LTHCFTMHPGRHRKSVPTVATSGCMPELHGPVMSADKPATQPGAAPSRLRGNVLHIANMHNSVTSADTQQNAINILLL
jgi:hypothetical protein